ncbi:hypothetical protein HDV02_006176 [Globomyces sp. JEL0801]|nr:hypothetical protein HDV02_006176 [Globomyces sp. JEL0801]
MYMKSLYPKLNHTFKFAQFIISLSKNPDQAKSVLALDLGTMHCHSSAVPCVHPILNPHSRTIYLSKPSSQFPQTKLLVTAHDTVTPNYNRSYDELWKILKPLAESISMYRRQSVLVDLIRRINPSLNRFNSPDHEAWKILIGLFSSFEQVCLSIVRSMTMSNSQQNQIAPWSFLEQRQLLQDHRTRHPLEADMAVWMLIIFEETGVNYVYKFVHIIQEVVNRYTGRKGCKFKHSVSSLVVFTSSLMNLSKHTPCLQSVSLASLTINEDEYIKEINEYISNITYPIPDCFERIPVTAGDALLRLLTDCPLLLHIDVSLCTWMTTAEVMLLCRAKSNVRCVNFVGCSKLPTPLSKLFYFSTNQELVQNLLAVIESLAPEA